MGSLGPLDLGAGATSAPATESAPSPRSTQRIYAQLSLYAALYQTQALRASRSQRNGPAHAEAETQRRLAELIARRANLEELLAVHRPDLRRGEALFPEFDSWDFSGLEHATYRDVLAELATLQARVLKGTKFAKMFRYRCADFLYLVVEENIFAEAEIPAGWGLLVRRGDELALARPPVALGAAETQRIALLENIALAATRAGVRDLDEEESPP